MGYSQVGFEVTGVDIMPQKHYPFEFIEADALEFLDDGGWRDFDAIHASPPCQGYSVMCNLPWLRAKEYPALIKPFRDRLIATGLPWVIENVYSAQWGSKQLAKLSLQDHGMQAGWLCGTMFGRPFYRHRLFETSFFWLQPGHPKHVHAIRSGRSLGGRARDIVFRAPEQGGMLRQPTVEWGLPRIIENHHLNDGSARGYGHQSGLQAVREAMEINWMTRDEITQAMPVVYGRFMGEQLLRAMGL